MKIIRFFVLSLAISLNLGFIIPASSGNDSIHKRNFHQSNILSNDPQEIDSAKQLAFERVFGDAVRLDPAMVEKVRSGKPGKRYYIDRDNDGKPEEVWFIDTDRRHTQKNRPILVRAIDEDNDLQMGGQPDHDSDLYIVDWHADGTVDVVVDYEDMDGDQDVDRMGMYFYTKNDGLRVWWSRDDGDDNLLWYDVDYTYYQVPCQDKTHFGGDETFYSMYLKQGEKPEDDRWEPYFENPFLFFDRDNDGVTEEVIRVSGQNDLIQTVRWSFDVDNDGTLEHPRDYDAGISALAPGWAPKNKNYNFNVNFGKDFHLRFGKAQSDFVTLRGIPSGPLLSRSAAVDFLSNVTWARVLLTWDENDLNKAWDKNRETIDRWEGVLNNPSDDSVYYMPAVGGPGCGPYNKRNELVLKPASPNEFYFNPSDHRIHIKNCDKAWINVDYNGDDKTDMYYTWWVTNSDGILDKLEIDVDGDGKTDDVINLDVSHVKSVNWNFEELNSTYKPVIVYQPKQMYLLVKTIDLVLKSAGKKMEQDSVWDMIRNNLKSAYYSKSISDSLINSDETMLYYLGLVVDRQIVKLKNLNIGSKSFWKTFDDARSKGDFDTMTNSLCKEFKLKIPRQNYAKWLAQRRYKPPHPRVAWDDKWFPPNWGWQSEDAAYRFYDGHFDMFGVRTKELFLPTFYPAFKDSGGNSVHHDINEWGMDDLLVKETGGIGGLTLYVDGRPYPVLNKTGKGNPKFTNRLIKETNDKVTLEFVAHGVVPGKSYTITMRPSALAGRKDSPIEVVVEGGEPGHTLELGIGIVRLDDETFISDKAKGVMGSWGFQTPEIGWIGLGIVYPADIFVRLDEQPDEHRVILKCEVGKPLTYHIQGDWLKGHRFSCCPSAQDWFNVLKETACKAALK